MPDKENGENVFCPECRSLGPRTVCRVKETYPVKGTEIGIDADVLRCSNCGKLILDENLDTENLKRAFSVYCKEHSLVSPDEVRQIRLKYGLGQRAFARLLGFGDVTIHRYEHGSIPDKAHSRAIQSVEDPAQMLKIIEESKGILSQRAADQAKQRIRQLMQHSCGASLRAAIEDKLATRDPDEFSGFRRFDLDKLSAMVQYFSDRYGGVYKLLLIKLLWYTDFLHFRKSTTSISGAVYVHLPMGPVPEDYDLILDYLVSDGVIEKEVVTMDEALEYAGEKFSTSKDVDLKSLSDDELSTLDSIYREFKDYSGRKIKERASEEVGVKETPQQAFISYRYSDSLSVEDSSG